MTPSIGAGAYLIRPVFNHASLADARLHAHVEDAWQFVESAVNEGTKYDVIRRRPDRSAGI